jgi:hypothetical protein
VFALFQLKNSAQTKQSPNGQKSAQIWSPCLHSTFIMNSAGTSVIKGAAMGSGTGLPDFSFYV